MQYRGRAHHDFARNPELYDVKPRTPDESVGSTGRWRIPDSNMVKLVILFFTCFAINSDILASAPNLTHIAQNFNLSVTERDSHLGALIQFGFYAAAGFFSILSGPAIEVIDRPKLLAGLSALSSLLSCLSGLVPTGRAGFFYFFLIRVSTGISVGIVLPTAFSLLGDLVTAPQRTTMSAFVTTSCAAGAAVGQAIAGLIGGSWRIPYFISAALTACACALLVVVVRDPTRAGKARSRGTPRNSAAMAWRGGELGRSVSFDGCGTLSMEDINWSKFQSVLTVETNRLIFAQSMPGCIAWSSIATFMPDFLHKDLGFSVKASTGVMAVFGIGGLLCSLVGSAIGQSIYNQNRKNLPIFVAMCICAGAVPMILLVLLGGNAFFTLIFAALGGIAATAGPNFKGMLMNANHASHRGTVFAMFNLVDNFGKGLGPSVLVLITWLSGGNRAAAFAVAFGLWFVSAWIASMLESCLDEDTLAVEIKQNGSAQSTPFDSLHIYNN